MRLARVRLVLLVLALVAASVVFGFAGLVSVDDVQRGVDRLGPAAPAAYVVVAAVLAALLVPGPVLAGASGLLFGPLLGTLVTVASSVLTSVIALLLGRAAGRDGARSVLGPRRAGALEGMLQRHGLLAVAGQRLAPGIPDAPLSYAFGALGVRVWPIVAGTVLGSAPRAFAYTAAGASLDDLTSPLGIAALVVWLLATVAGAEVVRRAWVVRRTRRSAASVGPVDRTDRTDRTDRADRGD